MLGPNKPSHHNDNYDNDNHDNDPVGLLAQWVERCTDITEVMGSNPNEYTSFHTPVKHRLKWFSAQAPVVLGLVLSRNTNPLFYVLLQLECRLPLRSCRKLNKG